MWINYLVGLPNVVRSVLIRTQIEMKCQGGCGWWWVIIYLKIHIKHKLGNSRLEGDFCLERFFFSTFFGMLVVRIWNTFSPLNWYSKSKWYLVSQSWPLNVFITVQFPLYCIVFCGQRITKFNMESQKHSPPLVLPPPVSLGLGTTLSEVIKSGAKEGT